MGWRTQDAYDREERERIRAVPLRERYACGRLLAIGLMLTGYVTLWWWLR